MLAYRRDATRARETGRRRAARGALALALALPPVAGSAAAVTPRSAEDIVSCARANLPRRSSVQTVRLESVDRLGSESRARLAVTWERPAPGAGRSLVQVFEPPDVRGTRLLILEREPDPDIWSYVPELGRVRRIHARALRGSFLGSQFSYGDIARLQGVADDGALRRLPDARVEGRPVYVVEGRPAADSGSPYARIVTSVDRETCVALRTVFFDGHDRIAKVMRVPWSGVRRAASGWIGQRVEMERPADGTRSTLQVEELEVDVPIPRSTFSQRALEDGRR